MEAGRSGEDSHARQDCRPITRLTGFGAKLMMEGITIGNQVPRIIMPQEVSAMPNFPAFLSYVLVATFTPGPNNIMSMSNASRYGFRKSLGYNFGVFFGFLVIISVCNAFSMAIYSVMPSLKPVMTVVGAAYILYLAWKTYRSHSKSGDGEGRQTTTVMSGMLMQFINPKVIIYSITIATTFIIPYYRSVPVIMLFSVLLAFVGFLSTCTWGLFGSFFQRFIASNEKLVNTVMALLLVYCAVSLFQ